MNTLFNGFAHQIQSAAIAAVLLDTFLKSVFILALAGIICAVWRRAAAGTRHLVWLLALLSLPWLPLMAPLKPSWQKPAWSISCVPLPGNQVSVAMELGPKIDANPVRENGDQGRTPGNGAPEGDRNIAAQFNVNCLSAGILIWLAGVIAVLGRLLGAQGMRSNCLKSARPLRDPVWNGLLNETAAVLRLRCTVKLWLSEDEVMPMTWGWRRAVVLLPAKAADWPMERRRVVLLHELAHIKRADFLTQIAAQLVGALYWFNPLVWLAVRQMSVERESACDDLVLGGGCRASEYATHLIEIAAIFRRVPPMVGVGMARSSRLEGRIAGIVDPLRNRRLRRAGAVTLLVVIASLAICLGGTGAGPIGADKQTSLRQKQIRQLEAFSKSKEKESETLAAAAGEAISPPYRKFFEAAVAGDWQTVTNLYEGFKQRHPQYSHRNGQADPSLRTSYWQPVLEICLAYDQVVRCDPVYTQMAANDIIDSMPAGSIYFGGTDPGRGLPTAFCRSQVDADPFYTLTQNALADGTYLDYLRETYGDERALLGRLAEACRHDAFLTETNRSNEKTLEWMESQVATLEKGLADAEKQGGNAAEVSDLERKIKVQRDDANSFEEMMREARNDRVKELLSGVRTQGDIPEWSQAIYIPTAADSQRAFQEYIQDAQARLHRHQLKPGEDVKEDDGRVQVSGQVAVMQINGILSKIIFDQNRGHEFFIEESFPLDWMARYLEPHGLILKINREPLPEILSATVGKDFDFWRPRMDQMIGPWLKEGTPLQEVAAFAEKVYLQHDLKDFSGDPDFVRNDYSTRMFSKLRTSIAGVYALRAEDGGTDAERQRMAQAADFAFRQAVALCPYSPEVLARYESFLTGQHRAADAKVVKDLAQRFKTASSALAGAVSKPPVFQIRLVLDAATDNTEPMRLVARAGEMQRDETLYVTKEILLDNAAIQSASLERNARGNPTIGVTLKEAGREKFAIVTREHLHQRLGIIIDGQLWEAPVVQSEITGGLASISGSFTDEEANDLVAKINAAAGER